MDAVGGEAGGQQDQRIDIGELLGAQAVGGLEIEELDAGRLDQRRQIEIGKERRTVGFEIRRERPGKVPLPARHHSRPALDAAASASWSPDIAGIADETIPAVDLDALLDGRHGRPRSGRAARRNHASTALVVGSSGAGMPGDRQIVTDPEQVDAIDGGDGIGVLDALGGRSGTRKWCGRWRGRICRRRGRAGSCHGRLKASPRDPAGGFVLAMMRRPRRALTMAA